MRPEGQYKGYIFKTLKMYAGSRPLDAAEGSI